MTAELKTPPKESYATSGMHVEQIHNKNVDSTWTTEKITALFINVKFANQIQHIY